MARKQNLKKLSLADLLDGKVGKANADLYKDEPEKRKRHVNHRVARANMISGAQYKQRMSADAAQDIKYHEVAREFISNGFKQTRAYSSVFGKNLQGVQHPAHDLFESAWMRSLILDMLQGTDGTAERPKEYALEKLYKQIESNVLDYIDDEGSFLNVKELKSLPLFAQQVIKKIDIHTWHEVIREDGEDDIEVRHQKVHLELYDKQKALELLAKAMQWIGSNDSSQNIFINANVMVEANRRVERLRSKEIEGDYEVTTAD